MTKLIKIWSITVILVAAVCLNLVAFAEDNDTSEPEISNSAEASEQQIDTESKAESTQSVSAREPSTAPESIASLKADDDEYGDIGDIDDEITLANQRHGQGQSDAKEYLESQDEQEPKTSYDLASAYILGYSEFLKEYADKHDIRFDDGNTETGEDEESSMDEENLEGESENQLQDEMEQEPIEKKSPTPWGWILGLGIPLLLSLGFLAVLFIARNNLSETNSDLKREKGKLQEKIRGLEKLNSGLSNENQELSKKTAKQNKDAEYQAMLKNVLDERSSFNAAPAAKTAEDINRQRLEAERQRAELERQRKEEAYKALLSNINTLNTVSDRLRWQKEIKAKFANVQFISLIANGSHLIGNDPTSAGNYLVAVVHSDGKHYVVPFADDMKRCDNFYELTAYTNKVKIEVLAEVSVAANSFTVEKRGRLVSTEDL